MAHAAIERTIEEMARRIVQRFDPEKVILFGSHARGTDDVHSDVDLLVVMDLDGETKRDREIAIRLALRGLGVPKDVLVVTPQEARTYADVVGTIVHPAMRDGRVLYERAS